MLSYMDKHTKVKVYRVEKTAEAEIDPGPRSGFRR